MPPVVIAAGIGAATGIAGAAIQSKAAKNAAKTQAAAAAGNNALAADIYSQNKALASPYIERGNSAGATLAGLTGVGGDPAAAGAAFDTFKGSTGYASRLAEGNASVNSNAYARGMGDSGATAKALARFGQNFASNEFGQYANILGGMDSRGQSAAAGLAGVGQNYAQQVAGNNNNAASASGNAMLAGANGTTQAISGAGQLAGYALGSSFGGGSQPQFTAPNVGASLRSIPVMNPWYNEKVNY